MDTETRFEKEAKGNSEMAYQKVCGLGSTERLGEASL